MSTSDQSNILARQVRVRSHVIADKAEDIRFFMTPYIESSDSDAVGFLFAVRESLTQVAGLVEEMQSDIEKLLTEG